MTNILEENPLDLFLQSWTTAQHIQMDWMLRIKSLQWKVDIQDANIYKGKAGNLGISN